MKRRDRKRRQSEFYERGDNVSPTREETERGDKLSAMKENLEETK